MSNKKVNIIIIILAVLVAAIVSVLTKTTFGSVDQFPYDVSIHPKLHALLNSFTAICILVGVFFIRKKNVKVHRICMFLALIASGFFLISYIVYHGVSESTFFGGDGIAKLIYYFILITHIVLAAIIFPLVLITVHRAITNQLEAHKKMAKITYPLWLYVAITGVIVYVMIAPYY